jgi:hypothetical protein
MSGLRTLLQDADPVRHEAPLPEAALKRVRLAVLRTPAIGRPTESARTRFTLAAAIAMAIIGAVVLGYVMWRHGSTTVAAAVRFEVRLAEEQPVAGSIVAQLPRSGGLIYLHAETVVSNEDVAQSWVSEDGPDRFGVVVQLLPTGAERLRQATIGHISRPIAILVDGKVVSAPIVRSPIADTAVISGSYTARDAESIARGIEIR